MTIALVCLEDLQVNVSGPGQAPCFSQRRIFASMENHEDYYLSIADILQVTVTQHYR